MYIIIESKINGEYIGAVRKEGKKKVREFGTQEHAEKWGEENCQFKWQVIFI